MTQKAYTLTLNRWHHVASRIKALAKSKLDEANSTLGGTVVENKLSQAQIDALKGRGTRALEQLHSGMAALETVGVIRRALADANGKFGVAAMLAEAEDKRARARALEAFSQIDLLSITPVEDINAAFDQRGENKGLSLGYRNGTRASVVAIDALDFVGETRRSLEAQAAAIADQVADLNRQTLTIELDESLAKEVGL